MVLTSWIGTETGVRGSFINICAYIYIYMRFNVLYQVGVSGDLAAYTRVKRPRVSSYAVLYYS